MLILFKINMNRVPKIVLMKYEWFQPLYLEVVIREEKYKNLWVRCTSKGPLVKSFGLEIK